jgi:hypothetical protein
VADVDSTKINNDVIFIPLRSTPTHNYSFAAAVLLKTINMDVHTIRKWVILNSGAMSHFLTTEAPAFDIRPGTMPIVARLPNGERVHSTHMCTPNIPSLPPDARAAHIVPGLASHSLLLVVTMCNVDAKSNSTKLAALSNIVAALLYVATNAPELASG